MKEYIERKAARNMSDMFDYDLCADCKIKEKAIDMRKVYLEKLKEVVGK